MSSESDLERVKGIEPSYEAWEAAVLPLNYTRSPRDYRQRPSRNSTLRGVLRSQDERIAKAPLKWREVVLAGEVIGCARW